MTDRQKQGIGFLISGGLFAGVGGVLLATAVTPPWVSMVAAAITMLANILGIVVTAKPDIPK